MTAGAANLRDKTLSWLVLLKQLPGFAPFLPLVWGALGRRAELDLQGEQLPGGLSEAERIWLAAEAQRTPEAGVIVQAGPPEVEVTCALAEGCWGSRRRVYAIWQTTPTANDAFRLWHRTVIRRGLAPYITPVEAPGVWNGSVDLLYAGESKDWIETARPGTLVVVRGTAEPADPEAARAGACGTLTALRIAPGGERRPTHE